jgi:hypothetical protein
VTETVDIYLNTLKLRVIDIGNLIAAPYNISLDDFILPGMASPLEDSTPFTACIRYSSSVSGIYH